MISAAPIVAITTGRNGWPISGRTKRNWKRMPTGIETASVSGIAIHGLSWKSVTEKLTST